MGMVCRYGMQMDPNRSRPIPKEQLEEIKAMILDAVTNTKGNPMKKTKSGKGKGKGC